MITLKSARELARMRAAGQILARTLAAVKAAVEPGVTTLELDRLADKLIRRAGGKPSFKGYRGPPEILRQAPDQPPFPAALCTSINDEVVHGIPSNKRRLHAGDLLSLDLGVIVEGYHADAAITVPVGDISPEASRLLEATEAALWAGIRQARAGHRLGDIGAAVQAVAERNGYGIAQDCHGHGIGTALHEAPWVPNRGTPGYGLRLEPDLCLAIEPMFTLGRGAIVMRPDRWTLATADRSWTAHFEHTVAIREGDPEILTVEG